MHLMIDTPLSYIIEYERKDFPIKKWERRLDNDNNH